MTLRGCKSIGYALMHIQGISKLDILPSMNEGDSLVAINALIAEHWMLCYPTHSRSLSRRAVARTGSRCAALMVPARNRETWQAVI